MSAGRACGAVNGGRRTIAGRAAIVLCLAGRGRLEWGLGAHGRRRRSVLQPEVLDDGSEGHDGEVRQSDDDQHDAGEQPGEQRRARRERARRRRDGCLRASEPAIASTGTMRRNRPTSIAMPRVVLYQSVLPVRPPKADRCCCRRRERVGHLGQAVRPPCPDRIDEYAESTPPTCREPEHHEWHEEDVEDDELHLRRLDLLAEVLRRRPTISPAMNTARMAKTNIP